eukprot:6781093-Alexandrium_andersonii.AAC.1
MRACPAPPPYALRDGLLAEAEAAVAEVRHQRWRQDNDGAIREERRKLPSLCFSAPLGWGDRTLSLRATLER